MQFVAPIIPPQIMVIIDLFFSLSTILTNTKRKERIELIVLKYDRIQRHDK